MVARTSIPPDTSLSLAHPPEPNHNALRFSQASSIDGAYDIPLNSPIELDGKTKAEVLRLRTEAVQQHPQLIQAPYTPSEAVFGQIADGAPWWGMAGQFLSWEGKRSIDGPAEESRFILNPLLLVGADLFRMGWWDEARIGERELADERFPWTCLPSSLTWHSRQARAEVVYDVTAFLVASNPWRLRPMTFSNISFSLIAYNARDWNLPHLYLDEAASEHVVALYPFHESVSIPQFLHLGGSCGYPGGCNNMSPRQDQLDWVGVTALPARAHVKLWKERPSAVTDPADMVFDIVLK